MGSRKSELRGWIEKLAEKRDGPLKRVRPMSSGQVASETKRDYQKLVASLAEQVSHSLDGHEIITSVVEHPDSNAWAFRNAFGDDLTSVVLVTNELIDRMQSISTGSSAAALRCLNSPKCPTEFLNIWSSLPKDKPHAVAFGRLMAHVTMVLLLNHEFAHIVIGHKFGGATHADWGDDSDHVDQDDGCCAGSSLGILFWYLARSPGNYKSQSLELDADYHAILWTKDYLDRFNINSPSLNDIGPEDKLVTATLMGEGYSKRFVLIAASWALFLVLGGEQLDPKKFSDGTHPQVGIRLSLMAHAECQLEEQRNKCAPTMHGAAAFGALIGSFSLVGQPTVPQIFDLLGFQSALQNWKSVVEHAEILAKVRLEQERTLKGRRIKSGLPKAIWWAEAAEGVHGSSGVSHI